MFCNQCGKQIDDNSKFCYACGATVDRNTKSKPVQKTIQNNVPTNNNTQVHNYSQQQDFSFSQYNQPNTQYTPNNNYNTNCFNPIPPSQYNYYIPTSPSYDYQNNTTTSEMIIGSNYYPDELQKDKYFSAEAKKHSSDTECYNSINNSVLPLFSSPLFIFIIVLSGISLIIGAFNKIPIFDNLTYYLPSNLGMAIFVATVFTTLMDNLLLTGMILLATGSGSKNTSLTKAALNVLSVYSYINFGAIIFSTVFIIFTLDVFFMNKTNITLFLIIMVLLPIAAAMYKSLANTCNSIKRALDYNYTNVYIGNFLPVTIIITSVISLFTVFYNFAVIFSFAQSVLLVVLLFILKARCE